MLQGDPALSKAKASWKATLKALKADRERYFITPASGESELAMGIRVSTKTQELLEEFQDLCQLPQKRDGAINLRERWIMP